VLKLKIEGQLKLNILYLVVFDGGEEEECCYIKKSQEE
jgi:hypothetical protein